MGSATDFRRRLEDAMGRRTLARFADEIGVSQSTLSRWLAGETAPSRLTALRIAERCPELRDLVLGARRRSWRDEPTDDPLAAVAS